eukprot:TRINITY_DN6980_c0_g1_i1.p1 TRINITY_DN6980_c0_g1~~TRINITY_DN6980_c0_g1_i1.p1  ORF type:complete len:158 (+),score=40.03 TRINITY_DN6980_c0_g1_i1:53-526(+)
MTVTYTYDDLRLVTIITCILGIVGAVVIIFTFLSSSAIRQRFGTRLIFYLSIANLGNAACCLSWNGDDRMKCYAQAVLIHYFELAAFCWSVCLGITVWAVTYGDRFLEILSVDTDMKIFNLFCWIFPAIMAIGPAVMSEYGSDPSSLISWCFTLKPV